jgi:hypothetical protein
MVLFAEFSASTGLRFRLSSELLRDWPSCLFIEKQMRLQADCSQDHYGVFKSCFWFIYRYRYIYIYDYIYMIIYIWLYIYDYIYMIIYIWLYIYVYVHHIMNPLTIVIWENLWEHRIWDSHLQRITIHAMTLHFLNRIWPLSISTDLDASKVLKAPHNNDLRQCLDP